MSLSDNSEKPQGKGAVLTNAEAVAARLGFQETRISVPAIETGAFAQSQLDKASLNTAPINPDWIIEGAPEARCRNLSQIGNYWTTVDHWSCTAGKFHWHYFVDESILILEGEAFITDDSGVMYHAIPGTTLSFPDGSRATWEVPAYVRKIAFNQKSVPVYLHKACSLINKVHRKLFK